MTARDAIYATLDRFANSGTPYEREYAEAFHKTMQGCSDMWKGENEEYMRVFRAVQMACQSQGSAQERWLIVNREVARLAHEYADRRGFEVNEEKP